MNTDTPAKQIITRLGTVRMAHCGTHGHQATADFVGITWRGWVFWCRGIDEYTHHYFVAQPPKEKWQ